MADKVLVTKTKLDELAEAVSAKSGEPVKLTIDAMRVAVLSMPSDLTAGPATPREEEQVITPDEGVDGFSSFTISPIPSNYGRIAWDGVKITVY